MEPNSPTSPSLMSSCMKYFSLLVASGKTEKEAEEIVSKAIEEIFRRKYALQTDNEA